MREGRAALLVILLGCSSESAKDTDAGANLGSAGMTANAGAGAGAGANAGASAGSTSRAGGSSGGAQTIASGGRNSASGSGGGVAGSVSTAGRGGASGTTAGGSAGNAGSAGMIGHNGRIAHVFVITLENHDAGSIVGNTTDAPYINDELLVKYASSSNFIDRLALSVPSEPHYVWMEAGTNVFSDHTFSNDDAASAANSTNVTAHLSTQLDQKGLRWISYQESIDATSGACPIQASGYYQPKHDPFVFFQDVSGNPPSKTNARCVAHHKEYAKLAADLAQDAVAEYNFITPNQCHDMHGQSGCPNSNTIRAGDDWLRANVPPLLTYCDAHDGVVVLVWDEGENTQKIPFLALGQRVKSHYVSAVELDHGSLAKTIETIFELPVLDKVATSNDFGDLFQPGQFP